MRTWFTNIGTIEELRKKYRELLKQYHPDNGGSIEVMQAINADYDHFFAILSKENKTKDTSSTDDEKPKMRRLKLF